MRLNGTQVFIEILIDLIISGDYKYIILCGKVFVNILKKFIVKEKKHTFKMEKQDGSETKNNYEVINITVKHKSSEITLCIAPQFAQYGLQGCLLEQYGEKVRELYGKF